MKAIRTVSLLLLWATASSLASMNIGTNNTTIDYVGHGDHFYDCLNVVGDNPWNPEFLEAAGMYSSIRHMDWNQLKEIRPPFRSWLDRSKKTDPNQAHVAYEWMIDLSNRLDADLWICVHHRTVDGSTGNNPSDYALRLSILVKTGVDMGSVNLTAHYDALHTMGADDFIALGGVRTGEPLKDGLRFILEYSNESFNSFYDGAYVHCNNGGVSLGLHTNPELAGRRLNAWASLRLFRAADLVFGVSSPRTAFVLCDFISNTANLGNQMFVVNNADWNPWGIRIDAIAIAPYVTGTPSTIEEFRTRIAAVKTQCNTFKNMANTLGVELWAYRGGIDIPSVTTNRSSVMYDAYSEFLDEMSNYFSLFMHQNHVNEFGGQLSGLLEYTGQPVSQAHKYRAVSDWILEHPAASVHDWRALFVRPAGFVATHFDFHDLLGRRSTRAGRTAASGMLIRRSISAQSVTTIRVVQ